MFLQIFGIIVTIIALYFLLMTLANDIWMRCVEKKPLLTQGKLVSVLIPARNEAANIERCVRSLADQTYQNYEIIVLDDNSKDETWSILQRLQAEFDGGNVKFRAVQGKPLEPGWNGKPFAMQQLCELAEGEILLCTDADTVHTRQSLSWAMTNLELGNADMLSGYARQVCVTFGEKICIPTIFLLTQLVLPIFLSRHSKSSTLSCAIGQYIALRKSAFRKIGFYEKVRAETSEDIKLARLMKENGFSTLFLDAGEAVSCRMYDSFGAAVNGISKNITDFFNDNLLAVAAAIAGIAVFLFLPFPLSVVLLLSGNAAAWPLFAGSLLYALCWLVIAIDHKLDPIIAPAYPCIFFALLAEICVAFARKFSKRGYEWKGRTLGI